MTSPLPLWRVISCRWLALAGQLSVLGLFGLRAQPAWADQPALCMADRPCVTELFVTADGDLFARWNGDYDAYNIRWEDERGGLVALDVGSAHTHLHPRAMRNVTYRLSVQGCNRRLLAPSQCSPWAAREVIDLFRPPHLRAATALTPGTIRLTWYTPDRAALKGFRVTFYPQGEEGTSAQRVLELPPTTDAAGIATYEAGGLTSSRTYCFTVEALALYREPGTVTYDSSRPSNTLCAAAQPAPPPAPDPCNPACRVDPVVKPTSTALAAPTNVSGTLTPDRLRIVLGWTAAPGATSYELVGSNEDSGLFFRKTLPAGTTGYTDEIGAYQSGAFVYELRACNQVSCGAPVTVAVHL